jgi:predicted nucleic acid-binding Zn ribbon protein
MQYNLVKMFFIKKYLELEILHAELDNQENINYLVRQKIINENKRSQEDLLMKIFLLIILIMILVKFIREYKKQSI